MKDPHSHSDTFETQTGSPSPNNTGLYATRNYLPLIARILLAAIFIWAGFNKILNPAATQTYMAANGMPFTWFFLPITIVMEIGGGLSLLLGIYPRVGAAGLALFTLSAAFIFHSNFANRVDQIMFMKNLSIVGGLLMIVQYGVGNLVLRLPRKQ